MLCFRCEHRARSLEAALDGKHYQPRFECGQRMESKRGCYMFEPCRPVVTKPDDTDRPRFAGALVSARERAVRVMSPEEDGLMLGAVHFDGDEVALAWRKKSVDKRRAKRV